MNFAYFRKSNFNRFETMKNLKDLAEKGGWQIIGEVDLQDQRVLIQICKPEWIQSLVDVDRNLFGFMPCLVMILENSGGVHIGVGQVELIRSITNDPKLIELGSKIENETKKLIEDSAGVEKLKPANVLLYSTQTCPYCKMEKQWLDENQIQHQVIFVDSDPKAAEEMVRHTGQMGVPVTEVQYNEGATEYIIGFDRTRLSGILIN